MGRRRPAETDGAAAPGRQWPAALAPVALALLGLLAYLGTVDAPFIYDDHNAIVENPHVRSLWPLSQALSAPDESTVAGRPVAALSLALNYAASDLEPWSYHLVNILIHLLCGLTLYGIARRTVATPRLAPLGAVPAEGWAFAVALVWLLHPLHTEVVTYVSTRTEALVGLFYLASLYAVIRGSGDERHARRWYAAAVAASALAMGSKEVAVTLPLVVLLYDGIFLSEGFAVALTRRRGLYAGLAATWLILIALVAASPRGETVGLQFADLTPLDYARTQVAVIWHYLRLAVWPHPLVLDYFDWPVARSFSAGVWLGLLPLLALVLGSLLLIVRRSWLGFLGGWFFAILAPSSSVVPIASELAAERRMYLPLAAVVALALVGLLLAATRAAGNRGATVFAAATAAAALALGALTVDRNRDYVDEVNIWQDTVLKRPSNVRALQNLGAALAHHGRPREAVPFLERALAIDPYAEYALENLGLIRLEEGRSSEAVALLSRRLERRPDDGISHLNLAKALLATGDSARALAALEEAVRLLAADRQSVEALACYRRTLELQPRSADAANSLALLLATADDPAVRDPQAALSLARELSAAAGGRHPVLLGTLGVALASSGARGEAERTLSEAVEIAGASGQAALAASLQQQLDLVRQGWPPPPAGMSSPATSGAR